MPKRAQSRRSRRSGRKSRTALRRRSRRSGRNYRGDGAQALPQLPDDVRNAIARVPRSAGTKRKRQETRDVPSLLQMTLDTLTDDNTDFTMQMVQENNYPQIVMDLMEDALARKALKHLNRLATFEFDEEEPRRMTMEDVNPGGYLSMGPVYALRRDAETFQERWDAWNQRRRDALEAKKDAIRAFHDRIALMSYPEIVNLLDSQ